MRKVYNAIDMANLVCEALDLVEKNDLEIYMQRYEDVKTATKQFPCGTTCCILGHMTNLVATNTDRVLKYQGPDAVMQELRLFVEMPDWIATKLDTVCSSMSVAFFLHRFNTEFGIDAASIVKTKLEEIHENIYHEDEPNEVY